jgi:hypothetical protein
MAILFSLLLGLALSITVGAIISYLRISRPKRSEADAGLGGTGSNPRSCFLLWPGCWLVIKSRNLRRVQAALGLDHPKACSWLEGLAGEEPLFIAPPVKGWILVTGSGVPDPCEDADAAFRFLLELSRKLGHVQCFSASRLLHHHAWIQAKKGRVVRAYAWAGRTLWNQGRQTRAEKQLGLSCYAYMEPVPDGGLNQPEVLESNVLKVPLLAARWSLDPERIYEHLLEKESGVAGGSARRF